jgi:predicted signal transduction protein with EAL and GGDEF domain
VQELKDGRTILVSNQPLAKGGWVDLQEDITEKRRAEQRITWLARHDTLTELVIFASSWRRPCGRRGPARALRCTGSTSTSSRRSTTPTGTLSGDALPQSVAQRLRAARARQRSRRTPVGGDEFAILQRNARKKEDTERLAARLLRAIEEPHEVAGRTIEIDASIGIVHAPENGSSADDLLKNVDVALYKAKFEGGGHFEFFTPTVDEKIRKRQQLEADLKYKLDRGEPFSATSRSSISSRIRSRASRRSCAGTTPSAG